MSSSGPYHPDDPDQQDCADEAGDQVADPSPKGDPEVTQNGAGNRRTDNAEHDVHDQSHVTLHELLCQPARNPADDDGCYPAPLASSMAHLFAKAHGAPFARCAQ